MPIGEGLRFTQRGCRLPDLLEVAVPAKTVLETGRSGHAVFDQRLAAVVPFLNQRLAHGKAVALDGGTAIGADANLREARGLLRKLLGLLPRAAFRGDIFA